MLKTWRELCERDFAEGTGMLLSRGLGRRMNVHRVAHFNYRLRGVQSPEFAIKSIVCLSLVIIILALSVVCILSVGASILSVAR